MSWKMIIGCQIKNKPNFRKILIRMITLQMLVILKKKKKCLGEFHKNNYNKEL
jgi:hypothetical protein